MFCHKKIKPKQKETEKEEIPIDFAWVLYIGINRLGLTKEQTGQLSMGKWADMVETFKYQYNFETKKCLYLLEHEEIEEKGSLLDL